MSTQSEKESFLHQKAANEGMILLYEDMLREQQEALHNLEKRINKLKEINEIITEIVKTLK